MMPITTMVTMSSTMLKPPSSLDRDVITLRTLIPSVVDGHDVVLVVGLVIHHRVRALIGQAEGVVARDLSPRGRRRRLPPDLVPREVSGLGERLGPLQRGRL